MARLDVRSGRHTRRRSPGRLHFTWPVKIKVRSGQTTFFYDPAEDAAIYIEPKTTLSLGGHQIGLHISEKPDTHPAPAQTHPASRRPPSSPTSPDRPGVNRRMAPRRTSRDPVHATCARGSTCPSGSRAAASQASMTAIRNSHPRVAVRMNRLVANQ